MKQQILVPLDGSQQAEHAIPHALALARAHAARLVLLRAIIPQLSMPASLWVPIVIPTERPDLEAERADAKHYLDRMASRLEAQGLPTQSLLQTGDPATLILQWAEAAPDDRMIVMATHARKGIGRLVLGSVAETVLHATPVPLLLIHASSEHPSIDPMDYRTIAVPLDGSHFAEQALDPAVDLATTLGARLELISVLPKPHDRERVESGLVPLWQVAEENAQRTRLIKHIDQHLRTLEARGLGVRLRLGSGEPAQEILRIANEQEADLIVMATHGRGGWQRMVLGSVAHQVVREATLPVLLLRPQQRELVYEQSLGATAARPADHGP